MAERITKEVALIIWEKFSEWVPIGGEEDHASMRRFIEEQRDEDPPAKQDATRDADAIMNAPSVKRSRLMLLKMFPRLHFEHPDVLITHELTLMRAAAHFRALQPVDHLPKFMPAMILRAKDLGFDFVGAAEYCEAVERIERLTDLCNAKSELIDRQMRIMQMITALNDAEGSPNVG